MAYYKIAGKGKRFVVTQKGYDRTRQDMKHERPIGRPVKNYEHKVPYLWFEKGWVEEIDE